MFARNTAARVARIVDRARVELRDAMAYSAAGRVARVTLGLGAALASIGREARIVGQASLLRLLEPGALRRRVVSQLQRSIAEQPAAVIRAHAAASGGGRDGAAATRTTLLKAPGPHGERGVIYSAFEYNWVRLLEGIGDLQELLRDYDVIWATSWSPTDYLDLARIIASAGPHGLIYVQGSNFGETPQLTEFHPRIRVVPNLLCEYLDPASFETRASDVRDIDLLVVSNWAPFKRHFELFRALRHMPASLRVVCVGQPERGHTRASIEQLAVAYGVPQAIEFLESLPLVEVRSLQARSKAAAIFSRREGSCVAAVEALFAGASLGLIDGAQVGSTAFVNASTGVALRPAHLSEDLLRLITDAPKRSPREWAQAHLGADRATQKLNAWLKERAVERELPWATDIVRMSWSPYPWVASAGARAELGPAVAALHARFPKVFGAGLLDESRY